jgi:hypothetical protein
VLAEDGRGLGLVAADFAGAGRLDLFVANDQSANFLFVNETPRPGDVPRFGERGLIAGVALGRNGQPQASMGVASADADGDGTLDLFITNFYREGATLYLGQQGGSYFADETTPAGLRDPTFLTLGFGTQFLDADLDGWPDLMATNGHIDDYSFNDIPFRMRPQFFHNLGEARFQELPSESLGPFFQGEYLGRGLARLDFDRDGREDVAISHIGAPAALLANQTEGAGHYLALRFHAVATARDAIGTAVRVVAGGRTRFGQLTAGDGYQASNQRQVVFGLGAAERVEELAVRWPSGREQVFRDLPVDRELVLVEGHPAPSALPRP